jgi:transcriptional regulator with XRE-family HTH domain
MLIPVSSAADLGAVARRLRKDQGLRQADLAAMIDASHVFLRDVEHGKPGVQLGRVLQLLEELGVRVWLDIPDQTEPAALPSRKARS